MIDLLEFNRRNFELVDNIIHNSVIYATQIIVNSHRDLTVEQKFHADHDDYDEVTSADYASQQIIVDTILDAMPDAGIIGEENNLNKASENGFTFIIDPIDGTEEFVRKGNEVSVMIACSYNGKVIASAIHNPFTNERYTLLASTGKSYRARKTIYELYEDIGDELEFKLHPRNRPLQTYEDARSPKLQNLGFLSAPSSGYFYPHFVVGGSYGTNMMKLASNQVCATITAAYNVKPWDSLPVFGILEALGYKCYLLQPDNSWLLQELRQDLEIYNEGLIMVTRPEVYFQILVHFSSKQLN